MHKGRILLIDPINTNLSHLFFNNVILSYAIKKCKFHLICEINHAKHLNKVLPDLKCDTFSSSYFVVRVIKSICILISKSFFRNNKILFLSLDNLFSPFLLLLFYPCLFRNSFSFIIHNNLTTLTSNRFKLFMHKRMVRLYKATVYVLTNEMKEIYQKNISSGENCICIPHPHYKSIIGTFKVNNSIMKKNKKNIVLLGRQAKIMADSLNALQFNKYENIHFTILYSGKLKFENKINITIIDRKLSYNDYYSLLYLADFSLFALDKTVENRASGILMDCISLCCPVIVPHVGHFLEYERFKIGYVYKDYHELNDIFETINDTSVKRVAFSGQFEEALKYSSPNNLSSILFN